MVREEGRSMGVSRMVETPSVFRVLREGRVKISAVAWTVKLLIGDG